MIHGIQQASWVVGASHRRALAFGKTTALGHLEKHARVQMRPLETQTLTYSVSREVKASCFVKDPGRSCVRLASPTVLRGRADGSEHTPREPVPLP